MRRARLWTAAAVALALAIAAALLAAPLTRSEHRLEATNLWLNADQGIALLGPGDQVCQGDEHVPAGASRLLVHVYVGAPFVGAGPVEVEARERDGTPVLRAVNPGPHRAGPMAFDFEPLERDAINTVICVRNGGKGQFSLGGFPARDAGSRDLRWRFAGPNWETSENGRKVRGPFRVDYPIAEARTPLQMLGRIAERVGLFKASFVKGWALWGVAGLVLLASVLALVALLVRQRLSAAACIGVAVLSAASWAILTPPLQTPDEIAHVGHVQYLAETGKRPEDAFIWDPSEEVREVEFGIPWGYETEPFWQEGADAFLREKLTHDPGRVNPRAAGFTNNNPPLYYLYDAVPYLAGGDASILDRLLLMRLWTALLAGALALFVFLFLREVMPRHPLVAPVGAAAATLHPLTGHISGGVGPDTALWVSSAAVFWLVARCFRRGLTLRRGVAIGVVGFLATLVKPAGFLLVPGVVVGLLVLLARSRRTPSFRTALVAAAGCGVAALGLLYAWGLVDEAIFSRGTTTGAGFATTEVRGNPLSIREFGEYLWQFWIPRPLGFMTDQFTDYPLVPSRDIYFQGFVGRFGWFAYDFGSRTETVALVAGVLLLAAAALALYRCRAALRGRWGEAFTYVSLLVGVALLVNAAGYRYRNDVGFSFEQTRYLFPALLPMWGLLVGLAVTAAPRRWRLPAAAFVVTLLAMHNVAGQLLTLQHYYL